MDLARLIAFPGEGALEVGNEIGVFPGSGAHGGFVPSRLRAPDATALAGEGQGGRQEGPWGWHGKRRWLTLFRPFFLETAMSRPMLATLLLALLPWATPLPILAEDQGKDVDKADEALPELLHAESEGKVRIDGKTIEYRATAGTLAMKDDEGEVTAHFGYTAYVKKGWRSAHTPFFCL